ncbi:MAG: hypothetical protein KGS61_18075 [Verrucomicrobia bacterium]|nr:hypothetical protein [Verrucomicrobiota bacterium]
MGKIPDLVWRWLVPLVVLALLGGLALLWLWPTRAPVRQAGWQQEAGGFAVKAGARRLFTFDGVKDRVFAADSPEVHFEAGQDFSIEAWIKAYPAASPFALRLVNFLLAHPSAGRLAPRTVAQWLQARSRDNDFGAMPIVDKHHPVSTIEAVGFQLYLDHGRLACQLASAPMRPLAFSNYISPGPPLQDGRWHQVAMTVQRTAATGGRLYLDGQVVLTFDPTGQGGDLSNTEPLRIGNHANPSLYCFFKGAIGGVTVYRRVIPAEAVAAEYLAGPPKR